MGTAAPRGLLPAGVRPTPSYPLAPGLLPARGQTHALCIGRWILIHWHVDSSRPGVRPTPSALAGGFLSTGTWNPPGQGSDPRPLHWQVDSYPLARGLLPARGQTHILCIGRWILIHWHVESSQPGVRPTSSALAGGFLSTAPPRKSGKYFDTNLSNRCETIPHCGFDLHFSVS